MSEENIKYFEVQKYDKEIISYKNIISSIDKKLSDRLGISNHKNKLITIKEKIDEQEKIQKKILNLIKENEDSINTINSKIYSGKIRNTKELEALELELKSKSEFISNIVPKKAIVSDNLTKLYELRDNTELKIIDIEDKWVSEEKKLIADKEDLSQKIASSLSAKNALSGNLDKNILTLYENFLSKNGNMGIGKLENNKCPSCKIELPNAFIEKIKSSEKPIICNCGKSLITE